MSGTTMERTSEIGATFDRLQRTGRKALLPFIMGGDPARSMTAPLLLALEDAGADLIEIGLPFSDPLADGPTIQAASSRALAAGATPRHIFAAVAAVRPRLRVPLVCLCYWNLVIQFDAGAPSEAARGFVRAAKAAGFSGLIVPDLPIEEYAPLRQAAGRDACDTILLAAPTSPPRRLRAIARASTGFLYYVSVTGTTGARAALPEDLAQGLRRIRTLTTTPICVGFGIAHPAQARAVARLADGVIVGSALIDAMQRAKRRRDIPARAGSFVRRLRRAIGT